MTLVCFHRANEIIQLPWWLNSKESSCHAGDSALISGPGRSPEEANATQSGRRAWEIPWTEKPGGLQSLGPQRGGHD